MKKKMALIILCSLSFVGCMNQSTSKTQNHIFITLQEAQDKLPFQIKLPKELPHGMVFDHAILSIDPNNGKANGVLLHFTSSDKNWSLEVNEAKGSKIFGNTNGFTVLKINGCLDAEYASNDKIAYLQWTDGNLVYDTTVSSQVDIGKEENLIKIAKEF